MGFSSLLTLVKLDNKRAGKVVNYLHEHLQTQFKPNKTDGLNF